MKIIEKPGYKLKVGDVLVAKTPDKERFKIIAMQPGAMGAKWPYLTLQRANGTEVEHDCSWHHVETTYTVEVPDDAS